MPTLSRMPIRHNIDSASWQRLRMRASGCDAGTVQAFTGTSSPYGPQLNTFQERSSAASRRPGM